MSEAKIFWSILRDVKKVCEEPSYSCLSDFLKNLPDNVLCNLSEEYTKLLENSNTAIVWEAGSLISGSPLGDDSFEHFRAWLIWNGLSIYYKFLDNPDHIVGCGIDLSHPFIEDLGAFKDLANTDGKFQLHPPRFSRNGWDWRVAEENIEKDLPKLWSIYGEIFQLNLPSVVKDKYFEVPGLGTIRVGGKIFHKNGFGEGVILEILSPELHLAKIKFATEVKPFRVTSDFFDLIDENNL